MQFLKVTCHLQLLQNIGYIPCVVQYILEPILIFLNDYFIFAWKGPLSIQRFYPFAYWTEQEKLSNLSHTCTGIIFKAAKRME